MPRFLSFLLTAFACTFIVLSGEACKSTKTTAGSASKTDSTATSTKPGNDIHTSGKVKTGTFVNGPAQDTSSTGTKPKQ